MLRRCVKLCLAHVAQSVCNLRPISERERRIEHLSDEIFGLGNVHLKNCIMIDELPEGLQSFPEVAFIGRTNVGKSSLIARLLHNLKLGRPSVRPGNTTKLQFFNVGDSLLLVDTPGYGEWRKQHNLQLNRARAVAITRQYLSLRKRGNLKMVYWVFGMGEEGRVQIGPREDEILEFLEREQIPFTALLNQIDRCHSPMQSAEDLLHYFGNHKIPLLETCAHAKRPHNIIALRHDLVFNCAKELPDGHLTVKEMRRLSYLPASAKEKIAVEEAYPVEQQYVPQEDTLPLVEAIEQHQRERDQFLGSEAALSSGVVLLEGKSDVLPLVCRSELDAEPPLSAPIALPTGEKNLIQCDSAIVKEEFRGARGPDVPRAMMPPSFSRQLAAIEKSPQQFQALLDAEYNDAVDPTKEHFMSSVDFDKKKFAQSARRRRHEEVFRRFIQKVKTKRWTPVAAETYYCPFVGDVAERLAVRGTGGAGCAHGGSLCKDLKRKGLGGRSVSFHTTKNKGRATKKVGFWAA